MTYHPEEVVKLPIVEAEKITPLLLSEEPAELKVMAAREPTSPVALNQAPLIQTSLVASLPDRSATLNLTILQIAQFELQ